ncbi:hypothetical protein E1176_05510 [Fulvivirga sp. RKSG066]|uniref:hypothetical protein n=1 Tax=Fulvivirga aurantia TaxID=2529383 RepID=UPI0012BCCBBA|nr:hypothetical protein [Fulvivirga aurantia]MTI20473.1 hypothetical protein [Fulvivirga aurantia]
MAIYYINKNEQNNGDHEVHKIGCSWLPDKENRIELGNFNNCYAALSAAKEKFPQANGCYHCSRECYTS